MLWLRRPLRITLTSKESCALAGSGHTGGTQEGGLTGECVAKPLAALPTSPTVCVKDAQRHTPPLGR